MRRLVFALVVLVASLSIGAVVSFRRHPPSDDLIQVQAGGSYRGREIRFALSPEPLPAETSAEDTAAAATPAPIPLETREYSTPETSIVISEVCYHPPGGNRRDEWIEVLNRSTKPVDIGDWKLSDGVQATIPKGTVLEPGGFLILCADQARLRSTLGIERLVGDWQGSLDDGGEKIALVTADGKAVDSLTYKDSAPFPVLPDGLGSSLERRCPHEKSDNPANWGASVLGGATWMHFQTTGTATANRLYLYLMAAGTAYVDDVRLRPVNGSGEVLKDDFEGGGPDWPTLGNHEGSTVVSERAHSGSKSLKVVASGPGSGRRAAVYCDVPSLAQGGQYQLDFWAYFPPPRVSLVARFSSGGNGVPLLSIETGPGGVGPGRASATPGRVNSIHSASLPPFIYPVSRAPEHPAPGEPVSIRASISAAAGVKSAALHLNDGASERIEPLHDDGDTEHGDAAKGDGVWSARVGPYAAGTLVFYSVTAEDEKGATASFPIGGNPTRTQGFFVGAPAAGPDFPVYNLFLSSQSLQNLDGNPFTDAYQRGVFVYEGHVYCDVGFRYRGQTSRGMRKHHWKIKFQRDDRFVPWPGHREVGSIDVNSSFGDKLFLREILAYNLWRDLGEGSSDAWHVRMNLNGSYLGFYVHVESPGDDYLARNHLEQGWLWKGYDDGLRGPFGIELKAGDPETGNALLGGFLQGINSLEGEALEKFIREHMNVESFVNYLAACQLIHSADHVQKNYLAYASKDGRFTFLPWDMDLTHGRNFECSSGGIWNDTIRHDMWDRDFGDKKLLFGTQAHRKCDGYVNAVIDAFLGRTEAFRPLYYKRLAEHLAHYYHPDVLIPKVERFRVKIRDEVAADRKRWRTYGPDAGFDAYADELCKWIHRRFSYLSAKLKALGYEVGPPLNADFESDLERGAAPLKVAFKNLSVGQCESYEWDFGDGEKSDAREPVHIFQKLGHHDVTLKVTGPVGSHAQTRRDFVFVSKQRGDRP